MKKLCCYFAWFLFHEIQNYIQNAKLIFVEKYTADDKLLKNDDY